MRGKYYDFRKGGYRLPPATLVKAEAVHGFRPWMDGAEVLGYYEQKDFYGGWLLIKTRKGNYFRVYYTPLAFRKRRWLRQVNGKWILKLPEIKSYYMNYGGVTCTL